MNSMHEATNKELMYLDHPRMFEYHQLKLFQDWQLAKRHTIRKSRPRHTYREHFLTK